MYLGKYTIPRSLGLVGWVGIGVFFFFEDGWLRAKIIVSESLGEKKGGGLYDIYIYNIYIYTIFPNLLGIFQINRPQNIGGFGQPWLLQVIFLRGVALGVWCMAILKVGMGSFRPKKNINPNKPVPHKKPRTTNQLFRKFQPTNPNEHFKCFCCLLVSGRIKL